MNRPLAMLAALLLVNGCSAVPAPTTTPGPSTPPTASPSPTATLAPTSPTSPPSPPSPTTSTQPSIPPTAGPDGLHISPGLISDHLDALQQIADDNGGIRAAGTPGYDASADYVEQVMSGLGFQVERHSFDFPFFNEAEPVTLGVGSDAWTSPEWVHAMLYSGGGDVEGTLRLVGAGSFTNGCDSSDWSGFPEGGVAMVYGGGGCYTRQKVELAQEAGALALISLYPNWLRNEIRRPTLLDPAGITIPAIAVGREPADAIEGLTGQTARISVHAENRTATVDNIIATLPGQTERIVQLGGHLDSVLDGPGLNDNGSGVATLLSMAASVAAQPQAVATIQFGFWSAEEFGDLGSKAYVDSLDASEHGRLDAYLNLDMVGSPNPARYVYDEPGPAGSADLTANLLAAFESLGAPATTTNTGGASDHYWFAQSGVPIGGVFSGLAPMTPLEAELFGGIANEPEDRCYHLACDTVANVDLDSAALMGQVVAMVLEDLAY